MNMLPFTNAPRFPNIGLTSTRGSAGTSAWKRSLSESVGFGICIGSATHGRRVGPSQEDPEVCLPGTHVGVMRAGQAGVDLADVIEVVDGPRREQLAQGHFAQGWVPA